MYINVCIATFCFSGILVDFIFNKLVKYPCLINLSDCHIMSASKDHEITWKLLHPELLTQDELLCILRERNVKLDEKTSQNKAQLVEVFKRVAMPQSQRSCFQAKTSHMEVDLPSVPHKLNSLTRGSQLKKNYGSTSPCTSHNCITNVSSQLNKVKLKRDASEMSETSCTSGESPTKKREKITWP